MSNEFHIAIVGCAHGELDDIYDSITFINEKKDKSIKLLLCCGDFQSIRNQQDLNCLACPVKYRKLGSFHEYYTGKKKAPIMTIFIGGNHEASNYLQELTYGGFVAPNIFYLGKAGVVEFGGLKIGGVSGIYKKHDFNKGQFEKFPYSPSTVRSVYHVRDFQIYQMAQYMSKLDMVMSHDWPRGITNYGDVEKLIRKKEFLKQDIDANQLGNPGTEYLLHKMQPKFWFSAHLHVKFPAVVVHASEDKHGVDASKDNIETHVNDGPCETKFLALDKCLRNKDFLQVLPMAVPCHEEPILKVDCEWLAILRGTHHLATTSTYSNGMPEEKVDIQQQDMDWVKDRVEMVNASRNVKDALAWPFNFVMDPLQVGSGLRMRNGNVQTDELLAMLELPHVVTIPHNNMSAHDTIPVKQVPSAITVSDPNEIDIDDDL